LLPIPNFCCETTQNRFLVRNTHFDPSGVVCFKKDNNISEPFAHCKKITINVIFLIEFIGSSMNGKEWTNDHNPRKLNQLGIKNSQIVEVVISWQMNWLSTSYALELGIWPF